MAEIEHFCDPSDKSHSKFSEVENTVMRLYSACNQMDGQPPINITIGQAVSQVQIEFINNIRQIEYFLKFIIRVWLLIKH